MRQDTADAAEKQNDDLKQMFTALQSKKVVMGITIPVNPYSDTAVKHVLAAPAETLDVAGSGFRIWTII